MPSFIDDILPEGALHACVCRSPFRGGRIRSLVLPALPGGFHSARASDIPGARVLSCAGYSLPVLADTQVRYQGEAVALLCGPDVDLLEELREAVRLELEPAEGEPSPPTPVGRQEAAGISESRGQVEEAFSGAEQIVEAEYRTAVQQHYYPDTQGAVARWNGKILTVFASTQDPFGVRAGIARMLSLPERRVRVLGTALGDTLEGKLLPALLVAAQAALLAFRCGRVVRLVYDREEDLQSTPKRPAFLVRHQTALDREGQATAARVEIYADGGAYPPAASWALRSAVRSAWSVYRIAALEAHGRMAETGRFPVGSFRAAERASAVFAAELHASRLGEIAQLDPYSWRKNNLLENGRRAASGAAAVLEEVVRASDFRRRYASYAALKQRRRALGTISGSLRGIGLALGTQAPGDGEAGEAELSRPCAIRVVLDRGRRLRIFTSFLDAGLGIYRLFILRAAALLGLDAARVQVEPVDTEVVPDSGPTLLGRALWLGLPVLEQCCQALAKRRGQSSLPLEVKRTLSYARSRPRGGGESAGARRSERSAWAATVIEVELDPVTLQSFCRGVWMAVEAGRLWDPEGVGRVLRGEVTRALGFAALNEPTYPSGREGSVPVFHELLLGAQATPPVHVSLLENEAQAPKGYEQLPHVSIAPAYVAAVSQAAGVYLEQVPVYPEVVQQCLET